MSSPTAICHILRRFGFRVIEWSGQSRVPKRCSFDVPKKPGVYALYFGDTLQHIGSTLCGLKSRINNQRNAQEDYKPHGSFSWFILPEKEILHAESLLIGKYKPPHSKRKPKVSTRKAKG